MSNTRTGEGDGPTVADYVVRRLSEWGVERLFGYAGDGINSILGALDRAGNRPQLVQPAHEELAALMACAHAKYTGELGVCLATQGPGAVHLLNGLYDAALDRQPVLAIVGQQSRRSLGGRAQQEIDLVSLFKDVAKAYVQMVVDPEQVRHVLDRACRTALAERSVTCVIIPHDVQQEPATPEPPHEQGAQHSAPGFVRPRVLPQDGELRRAAEVLNAGQRVAMLVGAGALEATDETVAVAEALGAGVAKALLGKAAVPDDLPFVTGSVGWLGTGASNTMLQECDTLLMVGSGFPYTEFLPPEGQARGVQIDLDPRMLSLRYPMEVALAGDSAETLRALLPLLRRRGETPWRARVRALIADWQTEAARRAEQPAEPLNPQLIFQGLSARLPDGCILAGDSGSSTVWYARYLQLRRGMKASLSGTLATMGSAVPYALAAKLAFPDRPVIATAGDGAMQMIGINALIDVSRRWRDWADPRLVLLVMNNRDLNYVTWEQRVMEGERKFAVTQDIPDFPFARYAELLGLRGIRLERPEDVGEALDQALGANRPVVIDALVDPNVPTLPPELEPEQEEKLNKALAGEADERGVRRQLDRELDG